jgi:Zn-dependent protease with chaperone function
MWGVVRWLVVGIFALSLAGASSLPLRAQQAQAAPQASTAVTQPASGQQAYSLPPDKLAKAIAISHIRNILDIVGSLWQIVVIWLLLATRAAAGLEREIERIASHRWAQGIFFFAAFFIILWLSGLPLSIYGHYVERSYQISVESWAGWFSDDAKELGFAIAITTPALLLFNWIVSRWPRRYWLGAWVVTLPILVIVFFVEPLVEPLFEKFEPLQAHDPALVADLEKVVARTGTEIPPSRMYLMKASLKTNGLNAYVTGIGATKRIVVWDTTAGRIPNDEILFIFAHECGHYVLNHVPKGMALLAAFLIFVYWFCARFAAWMVERCGKGWGLFRLDDSADAEPWQSSRTGFLVLIFAVTIVMFLAEPIENGSSRYFEHQADVFGQEAIHGIVGDPQKTAVAAFNDLGKAWLDEPNPNSFIEFWLYSHPSTQERANFAEHYDPWANGGHGEFFGK